MMLGLLVLLSMIACDPGAAPRYRDRGTALAMQGRNEEAAALFEKGLTEAPDDAALHYDLAKTHLRMGRAEPALAHAQKAVAAQPSFAEAHDDMGQALEAPGRRDEAEDQYREALRIKPDLAEAHGNLGNAEMQRALARAGCRALQAGRSGAGPRAPRRVRAARAHALIPRPR